jgi:predicted nucleic acid-binding protein
VPTALSVIGQRDPDDAEIVALAIALDVPLRTSDRDARGIRGLTVYTTADLARLLPDLLDRYPS